MIHINLNTHRQLDADKTMQKNRGGKEVGKLLGCGEASWYIYPVI